MPTASALTVHTLPANIEVLESPCFGPIWLTINGEPFPGAEWRDFVADLLITWIGRTGRLLRGTSRQEDLIFMNGPFEVGLKVSGSSWEWQARCGQDPAEVVGEGTCDVEEWVRSLLSAAWGVLEELQDAGAPTEDYRQLALAIALLQGVRLGASVHKRGEGL